MGEIELTKDIPHISPSQLSYGESVVKTVLLPAIAQVFIVTEPLYSDSSLERSERLCHSGGHYWDCHIGTLPYYSSHFPHSKVGCLDFIYGIRTHIFRWGGILFKW